MFCPRCKAEYRLGFIRCADCDIELVDHLPEERVPEEREDVIDSHDRRAPDFVVVATAHDPIEEGQICSFLQANGILAQSNGDSVRRAYGMGIEILVPREFADTA